MVSYRSNGISRGKRTKIGLIVSLLLALAICASFIGYGLWEGAKYERQANNHSSENAKYTHDKIAQSCIGITRIEAIRCRYDALEAQREYKHNQRDLIAQRQSALWAYIMGAAAVIGIALSAVGVWLVKTTFDETRKANEIALTSVKQQIRPYLVAENFFFMDMKHDTLPVAQFTVRNSGLSGAFDVKSLFVIDVIDGLHKDGKVLLKNGKFRRNGLVAPGGFINFTLRMSEAWNNAHVHALKAGQITVLFSGVISYRDAYRKRRILIFNAFYNVSNEQDCPNTLRMSPRGNNSN